MTVYTVEVTARALAEIETFFEHIAARSPQAAARWYAALRTAFESLQTLPDRCSLAPEDAFYPGTLRQHLYGKRQNTYRILFEVRGDVVYVVRVRHGRQDVLREEEF